MPLSDYLVSTLLDAAFRGVSMTAAPSVSLALFTTPAQDYTGPRDEVAGGSYARQVLNFADPPAQRGIALTAPVTFTGMPAVTVTSVAVVEDGTGQILAYDNFYPAKTMAAGDELIIDAPDGLSIFLDP